MHDDSEGEDAENEDHMFPDRFYSDDSEDAGTWDTVMSPVLPKKDALAFEPEKEGTASNKEPRDSSADDPAPKQEGTGNALKGTDKPQVIRRSANATPRPKPKAPLDSARLKPVQDTSKPKLHLDAPIATAETPRHKLRTDSGAHLRRSTSPAPRLSSRGSRALWSVLKKEALTKQKPPPARLPPALSVRKDKRPVPVVHSSDLAAPQPDKEAVAQSSPAADTTPAADVSPEADASPAADVSPEADASPAADVSPEADASPAADVSPEARASPEADASLAAYTSSAVDAATEVDSPVSDSDTEDQGNHPLQSSTAPATAAVIIPSAAHADASEDEGGDEPKRPTRVASKVRGLKRTNSGKRPPNKKVPADDQVLHFGDAGQEWAINL